MRIFENKKPKEIKEFYNLFIDLIPKSITQLKDLMKKDNFNYTFEEIKEVEMFYVKSLKRLSKLSITKECLEDMVATYFGSACRNYLGGKWEVELDKKIDSYGQIYIDYYDYEFKTGSLFYPYWYTWGLESKQDKIGEIAELIAHRLNLQIKDQEKIQGYKIKPIKDTN